MILCTCDFIGMHRNANNMMYQFDVVFVYKLLYIGFSSIASQHMYVRATIIMLSVVYLQILFLGDAHHVSQTVQMTPSNL